MAKFDVLDMNGKKVSTVELSDAVFGITPNEKVMHAAVVNFLANQRQGTQSTKTRSEVSGGGRKPWRQKGTGRARQGSTRSPQWTHGGVALGPSPRLQLSPEQEGQASGAAVCFEQQGPERRHHRHRRAEGRRVQDQDRREHAHGHRRRQEGAHRHPGVDAKLVKSAANIPGVKTATADSINTYEVLNGGKFVISVDAAKKLEEVFA